jgi:hypothetical protein
VRDDVAALTAASDAIEIEGGRYPDFLESPDQCERLTRKRGDEARRGQEDGTGPGR